MFPFASAVQAKSPVQPLCLTGELLLWKLWRLGVLGAGLQFLPFPAAAFIVTPEATLRARPFPTGMGVDQQGKEPAAISLLLIKVPPASAAAMLP